MFTQSQKTSFKSHFQNNTTQIQLVGGGVVAINSLTAESTPDNLQLVADWYNLSVSPNYWAWKSSLNESEIYDTTSDLGTNWNWATYKSQSVPEQNAWSKIFMGGNTNFSRQNNRFGVQSIFGGAAPGNAQRDHILAIGRRTILNIEKLFVIAVTPIVANTGNDGVAGNRGKVTNPDVMTFEGVINGNDVFDALLNG